MQNNNQKAKNVLEKEKDTFFNILKQASEQTRQKVSQNLDKLIKVLDEKLKK